VDWVAITSVLLAVLLAAAVLLRRRAELQAHADSRREVALARARGSDRARLQFPSIDLAKCIGCGACVQACPEDGVLALSHGQAVVVHGARCVGHGRCAEVCPTEAIALTLGDLSQRRDLPAIAADHEAVGTPGLFLAGEITGFALVRTAVAHGRLVARAAARRRETLGATPPGVHDLVVVGLGPAGLSCLLEAKALGLAAVGVDQARELGGAVAAYPRGKMVMTQPMDLPLHGRLPKLEYQKEELVGLWRRLADQHGLAVRTGVVVQRIERTSDGFAVAAADGSVLRARSVAIAVGRRGSPQKLGVPGEDLPHVAYSLLDAHGHQGERILVVGGGDSAIEAALALAEQPGNTVVLSYRRSAFARLKARNEQRVAAAIADGRIDVRYGTAVAAIGPATVTLHPADGAAGGGVATAAAVAAERVFVFAGGTPPFALLEQAGVSFDPAARPAAAAAVDRGNGLLAALALASLALAGLAAVRAGFAGYYDLPTALRSGSPLHAALRPQGALGLAVGALAVVLFAVNLAYLLRRHLRALPGSLRVWMDVHVATGIGALACATLHSAFTLRESPGGHALLAMAVVVGAGAVGRWFYAFVPRALNGRQQDLDEVSQAVAALAGEWDRSSRGLGADLRDAIEALVADAGLGRGFGARVAGLLRSQWQLRRRLRRFRAAALAADVPRSEVERTVGLARRSHRLALQLAHFEEVRGLLASWRWLHRWLALLLLLLTVVHVVVAFRYGAVDFGVFAADSAPR
jgi:thioredoxin reductase/Pyruvate/2-oxoacid:ferredoxin oxidoreductase delta subunit